MGDVLEDGADLLESAFLAKQQVLDGLQRVVDEVVPRAGVAVQHGRRFDVLASVGLASLAAEGVVRVGRGAALELEELSQAVEGEVALDVLGRVDDAGG